MSLKNKTLISILFSFSLFSLFHLLQVLNIMSGVLPGEENQKLRRGIKIRKWLDKL
jgi:hypothetical protein